MPRPFTPDEQLKIRRRLLEAGRDALTATGFRKTTVSQLARAAGISKGGFYLFFADKTALWMVLLREAEADLRGVLQDLSEA
ncbi:MAG: AcrR family transcriptional regulator, partial [Myxococcota bacterium]